MTEKKIRAAAESRFGEVLSFAQQLVRTPSITAEEGDLADLVVAEMRRLGYDQVFKDSTGNVVGVIKGSGGGEHILYNFHMDHVSPGNLDAWPYSPYAATIADGHLHGRGASDVKGAEAVQVYAAALIKQAGLPHRGDIIVTGVIDEEPGDMWGMRRLAAEVLLPYPGKIGLAVLAEATSLDIYLGHRGRIEIELKTRGQIGHSSAPQRGINAVYKMRPVLESIENLADKLPEHAFLGKSTVCVTNIKCSPGWGSIIPDECTIYFDRRFLPSESRESVLAEVQAILDERGLSDVASFEVRQLAHRSYTGIEETVELYKQAFLTDRDEPRVQKAVRALRAAGQNPGFGRWDFGTDGSWTSAELGIPTIGYSCGEEAYAHTPQDRVSLDLMRRSLVGTMAIALEVTA